MQVKICGVRTVAAATACAEAGADMVGINLVPGVRRAVDPRLARNLIGALGPVRAVGVFRDQPLGEVQRLAREIGLTWVQLHGDEPPEECATLRNTFRVIKALGAQEDPTPYLDVVDALLVDGRVPGSGRAWDYSTWRKPAFSPVFLAGGLDPDNVSKAIEATHPDGVDVASGVERDGEQDLMLIHAFVRQARKTRT